MADSTPIPAVPAVSPGTGTSEHAITKTFIWLSLAAALIGALTDFFQNLLKMTPNNTWIGSILTILGLVGALLAALGYQYSRTQVKVAAANAAQTAALAAAADAAANLGKP